MSKGLPTPAAPAPDATRSVLAIPALRKLWNSSNFSDFPKLYGTRTQENVDVRDIARTHFAAANVTTKLPDTMNNCTGSGASVREIIKLVLEATNKTDTKVIGSVRRAGDPAFFCADVTLAKSAMGFESKYSLEESVKSLF